MLRSMTGYGEAARETVDFVLGIEIKTVNNRFLKVNVKAPEEVAYLQNDLEEVARRRLTRGSVYVTVRFEPAHPADLYEIDEELVKKYFHSVRRIEADLGIEEPAKVVDLLALPGAVRTEEALSLGRDIVCPVATETMNAALDEVVAMRETEGENLRLELSGRAGRLTDLLRLVQGAAPRATEEHFHKLEEKVRKLLGEQQSALAPEDILKEAAILAERSDIQEEIARFESHLQQFSSCLERTEAVGRRLEFIVQEMFRESNTMASKASSTELNQHVVEMKSEVDRLKEQVQNIE